MKSLLLETSSNRSCLLLSQDGAPLSYLPLAGGEELSKTLGQRIQEELSLFPGFQPDHITVGTGPGSYTGIRVGVAMAKALAFGWSIPLAGFCSLQAFLPRECGPFAVLFDARMGGVYMLKGLRTETGTSFEEPLRIPLSEATSLTGLRLVSPHPERFSFKVEEASPDPTFLALLSPSSQSPLEPFPLSY
jgi:tRNA threonylcarbamoyl adenosine modification protein YeaZ